MIDVLLTGERIIFVYYLRIPSGEVRTGMRFDMFKLFGYINEPTFGVMLFKFLLLNCVF